MILFIWSTHEQTCDSEFKFSSFEAGICERNFQLQMTKKQAIAAIDPILHYLDS